ncbi:MAG TPA: peptidoglycan-associated lipoprotein Pal [Usitatibacteraceae bacterium]
MKRILITMGFVGLLAGCASKGPATDVPVENRDTATTTSPVQTPGTQGVQSTPVIGNVLKTDPLKDPNNILSKRVIYFDYDKDSVKPEFTSIVQAHAKFLTENRGRKIRLEGHADERGSREYNMALGQRRAEAVRKATTVLGVGSDRIETISFGEDKPKASGHDEAAWAQNRRVEIVYDGE